MRTPHRRPVQNVTSTADGRHLHLGYLLGEATRRFDDRVRELMAADVDVPLALANLAARAQVRAAHIHVTRHLHRDGSRLVDMALSAGMSKQAMATLVNQCEAWGIVHRTTDPHDGRARIVHFTPGGLAWLDAFERATRQAQAEFAASIGDEVATVVRLGLEAYIA